MLVILVNNTSPDDNELSKLYLDKNPIIVISVAPIPPGKNDKVPITIGTSEIIVVSKNVNSKLNATKL